MSNRMGTNLRGAASIVGLGTRMEVTVLRPPAGNKCHRDTFPATKSPVGQRGQKPGGQGSWEK